MSTVQAPQKGGIVRVQAYAKCEKCMDFTSEHCLRVVVSTESLGTPEGFKSKPRLPEYPILGQLEGSTRNPRELGLSRKIFSAYHSDPKRAMYF